MTVEGVTRRDMFASILKLHKYMMSEKNKMQLRNIRGSRSIDNGFTLEQDKVIIAVALNPANINKLQGKVIWRLLKEKEFCAQVTATSLFRRAQQLCRPLRYDRLWCIICDIIDYDNCPEQSKKIEKNMIYLRNHLLEIHEIIKPNHPYRNNRRFQMIKRRGN